MAGMFANGGGNPNMQYVPHDLQQGAPASPSFFGQGGAGRNIAGYLGDALIGIGGGRPVYAPMQAQRAETEQRNALAQQQQAAEYQRQMAIAQYKQQHPDPTALQQNYEYLKTIDPAKAESYIAAQANPQTLMTDPATGQIGFYPKGGVPGMNMGGAPTGGGEIPTVSDAASYEAIPKGAQFKDPQGNVRVKP